MGDGIHGVMAMGRQQREGDALEGRGAKHLQLISPPACI